MTIRIYPARELPRAVPGAVFTDGETSVILYNPATTLDRDWLRSVINSLLAEAGSGPAVTLSAVG